MDRGWIEDGSRAEQRPPREKNLTGMAPEKKTTPGFDGVGERRLDRDWIDVFVGWLLIPTRRGVGGFSLQK